ncbi:hypothetical protein [Streptomyces fructofermentans]|uniref:Uncharacterized protein n=1 Tax=Streptomyces fructofermentans TaxID=152141 RepID=A0A918NNM0_9ACTN|nr:hypothetical protein [Streptomyces fructofermentans]GGX83396.1 hypothetical protein GCM10010515_58700 [Streptomyces fructofermentans]
MVDILPDSEQEMVVHIPAGSLVTACTLGAALLLTGCGEGDGEPAGASGGDAPLRAAAAPDPFTDSAAAPTGSAPAATGASESGDVELDALEPDASDHLPGPAEGDPQEPGPDESASPVDGVQPLESFEADPALGDVLPDASPDGTYDLSSDLSPDATRDPLSDPSDLSGGSDLSALPDLSADSPPDCATPSGTAAPGAADAPGVTPTAESAESEASRELGEFEEFEEAAAPEPGVCSTGSATTDGLSPDAYPYPSADGTAPEAGIDPDDEIGPLTVPEIPDMIDGGGLVPD